VMPRMKNRRPSEQIKRTATVDRKPSIPKVGGEVIDLTMDSDEEDEEERERKNVRPLLLLKASKSCYEAEEAVVERDEGVGRNDMENDARGDLREEADDDQGVQVETAPAPVDDPSAGCATGQGSDMDDQMMEDPSFPTEEPAPERQPPAPMDGPSASCVSGQVEGPEGEEVEDDKMVEDPTSPPAEDAPEREQRLASLPLPAPTPVPELDPMFARDDLGMDYEDLPAIAAVDESAHQTESETETLDGHDGDAEMWDDTMVYGLDDADSKKMVDDVDEEEEEVDELASEEESDLDRAAEMVLNLLFGGEGMGACERYCRLCL
jgi:hypothetical protein